LGLQLLAPQAPLPDPPNPGQLNANHLVKAAANQARFR
jgi:hypothetical protein